jgi:TPR repeat protein
MMRRWAGICALSLAATSVEAGSLSLALEAYASGRTAEAARIYGDLAAAGDKHAQFNFALMFFAGEGVPQSYNDAFKWAWRAKLQGVVQSETLLARVGPYVANDVRSALVTELTNELAPAVADGDIRAILGMSLITTELAPRPDPIKNYVWLSMAVALGEGGAIPLRDSALKALNDRDQQRAQVAARTAFSEWCAQSTTSSPACQVLN